MIVFDLLCSMGHRFEGWFGSAEEFARQKERRLLQCPSCGSGEVERVPSAARFNLGAPEPKQPAKPKPQPAQAKPPAKPAATPEKTPQMEGKDAFAIAQMLYSKMLDELLTKSEDVGTQFPAEARRIYYQESKPRAIRGQATQQEHDELVDEGIPVARLPIPPKLN